MTGDWGTGSVYHRAGWLSALSRASGMEILPLVARDGNEPILAVPFFAGRSGPLRIVVSPPPRLGVEYLGPIPSPQTLASRKHGEILFHAIESLLDWLQGAVKPSLIYMRTVPQLEDARGFLWAGFQVSPFYTYTIPISAPPDRLLESFDRSVRSDLRRTESRVEVRSGGVSLLEKVHDFVSARYRAQHETFGPTVEYLTDLHRSLGPEVFQPIGAYTQGGLEAAAIVTYHRGKAAYWQGATRVSHSRLPLTDHLIWGAIRLAKERGCEEFELVGANTPRLVRYKSKFAPKLQQFFEAKKATQAGRIGLSLYRKLRR